MCFTLTVIHLAPRSGSLKLVFNLVGPAFGLIKSDESFIRLLAAETVYILPVAFDPRVKETVAAVAVETGVVCVVS
jgi:hypothetical protein